MTVDRTPLLNGQKMSYIQLLICSLLSNGHNYIDISERLVAEGLRMSAHNVRYHANMAAEKVPGDLPVQFKLVAWYRGAAKDVLTGAAIRQMNKRGFEK